MDNSEYSNRIDERKARFEEKVRRMEERCERRARYRRDRPGGGIWTGVFLLIVGGLLLARQAGAPLPYWLFSWKLLLIGIGFWIGVRHRFRGFGWMIPIFIGAINLADEFTFDHTLRPYIGPIILIVIGIVFIFRPRRPKALNPESMAPSDFKEAPPTADDFEADRSDRLDVTAVMGGVKKNVLTKNFRGGEIVTFMGGAEINMAQADFEGRVRIDCTNVFGGTKLIVPPDWEVQSDIVAIFGGVDDKRPPATGNAPAKVVMLDGTCLFGGVEIRSYY
jgi:predicted membrane protein